MLFTKLFYYLLVHFAPKKSSILHRILERSSVLGHWQASYFWSLPHLTLSARPGAHPGICTHSVKKTNPASMDPASELSKVTRPMGPRQDFFARKFSQPPIPFLFTSLSKYVSQKVRSTKTRFVGIPPKKESVLSQR